MVTAENFDACVREARLYITSKRNGERDTSYFRDYQYWRKKMGRSDG
jgi:hypothetical protein